MLLRAMPVPYVKLLSKIQKTIRAPKNEAAPAVRAIWAEKLCSD